MRFSLLRPSLKGVFTVFLFTKETLKMSQHPSFSAGGSGSKKKRNVLKRFERVALLSKRGQWNPEKGVIGLKKTLPDT